MVRDPDHCCVSWRYNPKAVRIIMIVIVMRPPMRLYAAKLLHWQKFFRTGLEIVMQKQLVRAYGELP
jgi:hypothetical protein